MSIYTEVSQDSFGLHVGKALARRLVLLELAVVSSLSFLVNIQLL